MASKRKRALPPWLQGVTVKKGEKRSPVPLTQTDAVPLDKQVKDVKVKPDSSPYVDGQNADKLQGKASILKNGQKNELEGNDGGKNNINAEEWTIEKAVEMSYKEFIFEGTIIYSHNIDDCNLLCDDILSSIDATADIVIGFDTEWPVTYEKGKQSKTALIQLCLSSEKCYLFHVSCMPKFPVMLKKLIESHHIKKVGLSIEGDFWKLDTDFDVRAKDIIQKSTIELKILGNKKLRSAETWSLEGLAKNVLRVRISKDPSVRKCDWRQFPLPEAQQRYAATDAIVSLLLYQKLMAK